MKLSLLPALLPALSYATPYRQTGVYMEKNFDWGNMYNSINEALVNGYNRFYVGFYMVSFGCQAGCAEWARLADSQRSSVKQLLAQYNAKLYLSVGGPGEFWEDCIDKDCAADFGTTVGAYAKNMGYDGVDMAITLRGDGTTSSSYANDGSFLQSAQDLSQSIRSSGDFDSYQMSLSSGAPLFSANYYSSGVTQSISQLGLTINANQPWAVYDLNLMMFNLDGNYMTEQDVFFQNTYIDPVYGQFGQGSSVQEVLNLGMNNDQVAVLKPAYEYEASVRNGYVGQVKLAQWGCDAETSFGFQAGFVGWTWNSAQQNYFQAIMNFGYALQECTN